MKRMYLGIAALVAAIVVAAAGAAGPAPTVTVDAVTDHSVTLGSLACATHYKIRVQVINPDGTLSATTTKKPMTDACAPPPPPPPSGEPAPIAGQGYHVAFSEDFNSFDTSTWDRTIWYDSPPQSDWLANGFQSAENGVLHLRTGRSYAATCADCAPGDWPINTVTTHTSDKTFQYGYFEARMKWTAGAGAWPAFWLVSQGWANTGSCSTPAGELDIFEGQGTEPDVFYGTVHRNASGLCQGQYPDDQNGNNYQPTGVNLTTGFHDYGMLWEPGHVAWYLDGVKLMDSDAYYSTLDQPMMLLLQEWVGGWTSDPNSTTPDVIENQIDWVHVWQK